VKKITKILVSAALIFVFAVPTKAAITPDLMTEWSRQPANVQWNVYNQHTNIQVVDTLPWESPSLYETWAYTTMNVIPGTTYVSSIDMYVKTGCESSFTHEVGHCISNAGHSVYWWCYRPEFVQIWQQERYNCPLLIGQGADDIREYFACAYDAYIRFRPILKQCCPQTYNYMIVVLQNT